MVLVNTSFILPLADNVDNGAGLIPVAALLTHFKTELLSELWPIYVFAIPEQTVAVNGLLKTGGDLTINVAGSDVIVFVESISSVITQV